MIQTEACKPSVHKQVSSDHHLKVKYTPRRARSGKPADQRRGPRRCAPALGARRPSPGKRGNGVAARGRAAPGA